MTHELILTSVSQGLEPGTHGYCTVAKNQSIPRHIVKRLETLSGYQHLVSADSEDARLQPIVYSHLIFSGHNNTIWHTLSRIAAAGTDYQHEPNQLAHHIVLGDEELVPEGPAWLLALPNFHLTEWQTPSVQFPVGRKIPTLTLPPPLSRRQRIARERVWADPYKMLLMLDSEIDWETYRAVNRENESQITLSKPPNTPCPLWQESTGDAGWGGILTETIRTGQQALILFQPGQNILPLFVESLALLPAELMWKGTFSTYYSKELPEHVACQWKAVPVGSPIADKLLKNGDQLILDLTRPLGAAPAGAYIDFARSGVDSRLPKEILENVFQPVEITEVQSDVSDETPAIVILSTVEISAEAETPVPVVSSPIDTETPPVPPVLPPVIVAEPFKIQTHNTSKQHGLAQSLVNMQSRRQFYLLYGITLLLVLLLLLLVADQAGNLGIFRSVFGTSKTVQKVAALPVKQVKSKEDLPDLKNKPETKNKLDDEAALEKEKKRKEKEEQNQIKAAQAQKKHLQEQANILRGEFEKKKKQVRTKLDDFLTEPKLPPFLPMPVPAVKENKEGQELQLSPPEPKVFSELSVLFPLGLALDLKFVPLLDIPKIHVETRKQKLNRKLNDDNGTEPQTEPPVDSEELPAELSVPDDSRFQWLVVAVDTETNVETPMFDLDLTEKGLSVAWCTEGLATQHLYDTLAASFGFLRVQTEGESIDLTRVRSIPLFEPKEQSPIFIAKQFSDPAKQEFIVKTPLATPLWKMFFNTTKIPFSFRLSVTVKPESPDNLEKVDKSEPEPTRFRAEFQTRVDSPRTVNAKTVSTGSDTYPPITIEFEASLEPDRIIWHDRYNDQINILKEEQKSVGDNLEEMKKNLETTRNNILKIKDKAEEDQQRGERNRLNVEIKRLENRLKEIKNILDKDKIPAAHESLVQNEQLRFEYSVYLVPPPREDEKEESLDRLRNEESLLLMKSQFVPEPKAEQKTETPAENSSPDKEQQPEP